MRVDVLLDAPKLNAPTRCHYASHLRYGKWPELDGEPLLYALVSRGITLSRAFSVVTENVVLDAVLETFSSAITGPYVANLTRTRNS